MPLTLRPTGLGSGIAKDRPDYTVVAGEWEVRRIYEKRMIAGRQACFCEALRSLVIASSRSRTDRVIVMEIPVRMRQTRTATETEESPIRTLLSGKDH
jgi:hypothetical protein